ncbi:ABC transporter permease [bacterium]|nr:ABC transporter permease [bacterium]
MKNIFKIAFRNLLRYQRRTYMTASLITVGIVMVIILGGVTASFKEMMINDITHTTLGHIQIHKRGYISATDIMPLDLYLQDENLKKVTDILDQVAAVEAYSLRIKFGGMISNYTKTAQVKFMGVDPGIEDKTCPKLRENIIGYSGKGFWLKPGEIIVPENVGTGLGMKLGDSIVVLANNREGSMNALTLVVAGFLGGSMSGPSGRNCYVHLEDVKVLMCMDQIEIHEIALQLKSYEKLEPVFNTLKKKINLLHPLDVELHTWREITPFVTIERIINLFAIIVKVILVFIVLISVWNVMMMSVYERIREIGTIAAMGTLPRKIVLLFLVEGTFLGAVGLILGNVLGLGLIFIMQLIKFRFDFGPMQGLVLMPKVAPMEILLLSIIVLVIAVVASLQPAKKAAKLEPIEALRHV